MVIVNKKGQVAIYVIVALAILAVVLIFLIYPKIRPGMTEDVSANPQGYLSNCLNSVIKEQIAERALHGGDIDPEGAILFNNEKIKYLCYTSDYYKTCTVQEPLIKERMEEKLSTELKAEAEKCVDLMVQAYEKSGFSVSKTNTQADVNIDPNQISVKINSPMTITKETSRTYKEFEFNFPSQYYQLFYIASSIVDYEATFGNSETTAYLVYYPEISIDKIQLGDGTRIYKISNTLTKEAFTFAVKSLVWPPGGYQRI